MMEEKLTSMGKKLSYQEHQETSKEKLEDSPDQISSSTDHASLWVSSETG